jgi:hypothetical protein
VTDASVPERIERGDQFMSKHVAISPTEAADRLAIRELVEANSLAGSGFSRGLIGAVTVKRKAIGRRQTT